MKILNYINPKKVYNTLLKCITELRYYNIYIKIISQLNDRGALKHIGMTLDYDKLYFGVDLNPELLLYGDEQQETVELKFVSDKIKRHTEFLKKEGILDSITADYDRIQTVDHYGYVIEIKYEFKEFSRFKLIYGLSYLIFLMILLPFLLTIAYIYS